MIRQAGQSMVELAVAMSSLAALVLGALSVAGLQEMDRRTVVMARELAWRESWGAGAGVSQRAVRQLHERAFSDAGAHDATADQLLVASSALSAAATRQNPDGIAAAGTTLLLAPLRVASGFLGETFDLSGERLVNGIVTATVAPAAHRTAPFDQIEVQLRAPFALLGDAWHASGPQQVRHRASGLVPTQRLRTLNALWAPLSVPLSIFEPSLGRLCLGLIEPDRIPEDRLGPGRTPLSGACP